jgi:hypothetical protein
MAYDIALAERVRAALAALDVDVVERKMFGGLAFMLHGHMAMGVVGGELMLRLGPDGAVAALRRQHVREMDFTGRPMRAMVFIEPAGTKGKALTGWVEQAVEHVRTLPPK